MKTILFSITLCMSLLLHGQSDRFANVILRGKQMLAEADTATDYVAAANYFERIRLNETTEWLPGYYQAYALSLVAMGKSSADEKEALLKEALDLVGDVKKIETNAELLALEGFIQMMRLSVDPATRGRTLSPKIYKLFGQALGMEPENPRATLFMGQMEYGSAQFFGKSTDEACNYIQKAVVLLEAESDEDTILPTWGMESTPYYVEKCNQ